MVDKNNSRHSGAQPAILLVTAALLFAIAVDTRPVYASLPLGESAPLRRPLVVPTRAAGPQAVTPPVVNPPVVPRFGNMLVKTKRNAEQILLIDPDREKIEWAKLSIHGHPLQNQLASPEKRLLFKAEHRDILSFPSDNSGGIGTAAKAENRMVFTGVLAVGGNGVYGAAAQVHNSQEKILLFEAYGASHHQGTIWTAPEHTAIEWLGWGGEKYETLYFVLREADHSNLFYLSPTFPDWEKARRECHYSSKPATDCMMKLVKDTSREAVLVQHDVEHVWVSAAEIRD